MKGSMRHIEITQAVEFAGEKIEVRRLTLGEMLEYLADYNAWKLTGDAESGMKAFSIATRHKDTIPEIFQRAAFRCRSFQAAPDVDNPYLEDVTRVFDAANDLNGIGSAKGKQDAETFKDYDDARLAKIVAFCALRFGWTREGMFGHYPDELSAIMDAAIDAIERDRDHRESIEALMQINPHGVLDLCGKERDKSPADDKLDRAAVDAAKASQGTLRRR